MPRLRKMALFAAIATLVHTLAVAEAGDPAPQRIHFDKGKSSATIHGTLKVVGGAQGTSETHAYKLQASVGQVFSVRFEAAEPHASYSVTCPGNGNPGANGKAWSFTMPQSGDYTITVDGWAAAKSFSYTLEVGVAGKPHPVVTPGLTGTWSLVADPDQSIEFKDENGKLRFAVHALWKGMNYKEYGPNIGEIGGIVEVRNGKGVFKDAEAECTLSMTFKGDKLDVTQEGSCGFGHNVNADGAYKRTSACAAPERSEDL
jgi:hypothetical protein